MFCRKCGKKIPDTAKFCPFCGAEVPESIVRINQIEKKKESPVKTGSEPIVDKESLKKDEDLYLYESLNKEGSGTSGYESETKKKSNTAQIVVCVVAVIAVISVIVVLIASATSSVNTTPSSTVKTTTVSTETTTTKTETTPTVQKLKITLLTNVKIRDYPSTKIGLHVAAGKKGTTYEVSEYTQNDGYTWYKVGYDQWIADDGSYASKNGGHADYVSGFDDIGILITNEQVNICVKANGEMYRQTKAGDCYVIQDMYHYEGDDWFCVGENEWIHYDGNVTFKRVNNSSYLFSLTVRETSKSVYNGPSKDYGEYGEEVRSGSSFNVYDVAENDGNVWYCISSSGNKWLRNTGNSFSYN